MTWLKKKRKRKPCLFGFSLICNVYYLSIYTKGTFLSTAQTAVKLAYYTENLGSKLLGKLRGIFPSISLSQIAWAIFVLRVPDGHWILSMF